MNRILTACFIIFLVASFSSAQELKPVADTGDQALAKSSYFAQYFIKPADDSDTVNSHAVVCFVKNMRDNSKHRIVIAIDSDKADSTTPNILRFDFTGKGNFKDAPTVPIEIKTSLADTTPVNTHFGPATIQVTHNEKTLPVMVQGSYYRYPPNRRYLSLNIATVAETTLKFGEKSHTIRLISTNSTLTFGNPYQPVIVNDAPFDIASGDTIIIDLGQGKTARGLYGQPIMVDGVWYDIALSADKSQLEASPAKLEAGTLQIDQPDWSCTLLSKKHAFLLSGNQQPMDIPADTYVLSQYSISGKPSGSIVGGASYQEKAAKRIEITAGKVTHLQIGPPLTAKIETKIAHPNNITFSFLLKDKGGNSIRSLSGEKGRPPQPKVTVVDSDGKTVYENTLEYG